MAYKKRPHSSLFDDDSDEESFPMGEKDADQRTMYDSTNGSRFSTSKTAGSTLRSRFQGAVRDVESHAMQPAAAMHRSELTKEDKKVVRTNAYAQRAIDSRNG